MQYIAHKLNDLIPRIWSGLPITPWMRTGLMWLLNPKFSVGVTGVVTSDDGKVLLLKHTYRGARAWGLLGGGLKAGESLQECLCREMQEETGLQIVVDKHLLTTAIRTRQVIEIAYACHLRPGQTLDHFRPSAEVEAAHFFSLDALPHELYAKHMWLIKAALKQRET